ncbi:rRNA maturation RNase YbeY [Ruoffia tabacinasalis]|uniref:rRNA maturation RNase YbeY n=1 Tax=Ruoffia tabacinasalis TaxID=87458 RepID=UPI0030D33D65
MIIDLIDEDGLLTEEHTEMLNRIITQTAHKLGLGEGIEVDISIVSNDIIHELNKEYRGIDRPTDVLSFALEEDVDEAPNFNFDSFSDIEGGNDVSKHLGDIIISFEKTVEQAEDYGHSVERELAFLAVHGFLHLNGYDHQTEADEKEMFSLQEEVLEENGFSRGQ